MVGGRPWPGCQASGAKLQEVACIAKPDTFLAWYRRLVAQDLRLNRRLSISSNPWFHFSLSAVSRASREAVISRGSRSLLQTILDRIDSCDLLFHQLEDRRPEVSRDASVALRSHQPVLQEDMAEASRAKRWMELRG